MSTAVTVMICVIAVCAFLLLWVEGVLKSTRSMMIALFCLGAAFCLRILCLNHETLDYQNFLSHWVAYFRSYGGFAALGGSVGNYNVPYLYCLAFFSQLKVPDLYLIKLLSIMFDVVLAWASMKLVSIFTESDGKKLFTFLAVMLLPTVILNGAYWGQCDSIYVAFAVMSIWLALSNRPVASMVAIAFSFAFKLQAVFVMPLFLVLWYTGKFKLRHFVVFPLTYIVIILPAVMNGKPFIDTLTLYFSQTDTIGSGLNYNSPSVFAFARNVTDTELFSKLGIAAAFLFLSLIFIWLFIKRSKVSNRVILSAAVLMAVGVPFFLPHMHDRYFFAADILSLIFAVAVPAYFPVPVFASFASLLGYHAYLRMRYLLPMSYGSVALIVVMALLIADIFLQLRAVPPGADANPAPSPT